MLDGDAKQTLPIGFTLIMAIGAVLILVAVGVQFFVGPALGGRVFTLWPTIMISGSVFMLAGVWLRYRWYRAQKSRGLRDPGE